MKKYILLMGAPGAGKGTLAKKINSYYHFPHISTGDMFREAIKNGTKLGVLAKSYLDKGDLVPDEVTIALVKERLSKDDCEQGFLLDGFPRTLAQAEALSKLTNEINRPIEIVINLECDNDEIIRRISGRRVCRNCATPYHIEIMKPKKEGICDVCGGELYQRADDNEETIANRLHHYNSDTKPLLDYYNNLGLVVSFNSLVDSNYLFDEVSKYLEGK